MTTHKHKDDPGHEPSGFDPALYPTLSTLHRAALSLEGDGHHRGAAPKTALDINALMALLVQYGPLIAALIAQLSAPKPAPVPVPTPVPTPTPTPVPVPPIPQPPLPPPAPAPPDRRIASGKSTILGVEGWSPSRGHFSLGAGTVQGIRNGTELCGAGYRIHIDSTPFDQNRRPFFNADVHTYGALFAQFPEQIRQDGFGKWTCGEGNNRINHYVTVNGREYGPMGDLVPGMAWQEQEAVDLTSETDDAACTPVLTVPQDIALDQQFDISYRAEHVAPDGTVTRFDPSPTFKVHAWGF